MSRDTKERASPLPGQKVFLAVALVVACGALTYFAVTSTRGVDLAAGAPVSNPSLDDIPFDGARAYEDLKRLCALGNRRSGSPGMESAQKLLTEHFQKLGGQVELQRFNIPHPVDGSEVPGANLIVRWHPEATERVLLCTHYDTLPLPLKAPKNPKGTFIGANDGTSGVAILMELGREMPTRTSKVGVDFALFDAEEFIFDPAGPYFLGATHFAQEYVKNRPPYRYRWGVLLDMVGDADLQLYQEGHSILWADTRPLVTDIWRTARRLGVREFIAQPKYDVLDDHVPLHDAGIPTCDIIDFDYPVWHTQDDVPSQCSALSLAKVGWVLSEWLKSVK